MDRNSEEYALMREKALSQLRSGESLTGKDGAFGPLLKEFLEAALDGEMSSHLNETERLKGNKRNGRGSKRVKTIAGEIEIEPPKIGTVVLVRRYLKSVRLFWQTICHPKSLAYMVWE